MYVFANWQGSGGYYGVIVIVKTKDGYLTVLDDEGEEKLKSKTKAQANKKAMKIFKPILKQFKEEYKEDDEDDFDYDVWLKGKKILRHKSTW